MAIEWRDVPGYEGLYKVSNFGDVTSVDREAPQPHGKAKKLKGCPMKARLHKGYRIVNLSKRNRRKTYQVHTLVMLAFVGPRPNGGEVCHGANGKLDNSLTNLHYGTKRDNALDRHRDGTMHSKPVIRGDGKEFRDSIEAAKESGCLATSIRAVCRGKLTQTGGYTWRLKK